MYVAVPTNMLLQCDLLVLRLDPLPGQTHVALLH